MSKQYISSESEPSLVMDRAIQYGTTSLNEPELLSIILDISIESARELYHKVIPPNKKMLASMSENEISQVKGIGKRKAMKLKAIMDFGRRILFMEGLTQNKISKSRDAYENMKYFLTGQEVEQFYVIMLTRANKIISFEKISEGGTAATIVDPKIVFKRALLARAHAIILVHNHPSGNLKPSEADLKLTKRLVKVGRELDVEVMDHLIFSDNGFFSFSDEGIL